jgi:hypothetical protein
MVPRQEIHYIASTFCCRPDYGSYGLCMGRCTVKGTIEHAYHCTNANENRVNSQMAQRLTCRGALSRQVCSSFSSRSYSQHTWAPMSKTSTATMAKTGKPISSTRISSPSRCSRVLRRSCTSSSHAYKPRNHFLSHPALPCSCLQYSTRPWHPHLNTLYTSLPMRLRSYSASRVSIFSAPTLLRLLSR